MAPLTCLVKPWRAPSRRLPLPLRTDEDDEAEPEDDFNAAWEVLDLARAIYEKQKAANGDEQVGLKLADTYITLGDVSLETGVFAVSITR